MKIVIKNKISEDYTFEQIEVLLDDKIIFETSASSDSPEDNTLSRMGIFGGIEKLIKEINPEVELEVIDEEI